MTKYKIILFLFLFFIFLTVVLSYLFLGPVDLKNNQEEIFVVQDDSDGFASANKLKEQNLIRNSAVFSLLYGWISGQQIKAGGYKLNRKMTGWQVIKKLSSSPDLVWIKIREGLRKEQIGEILREALGWQETELYLWNSVYTAKNPDYFEGVYFPDKYLIPVEESGLKINERLINRFNEKIAPLSPILLQKNIKWTTALKIASLIQREAGGIDDMAVISGVIWNRLDKDMKLEIDATMQYTRGKVNDNWWSVVDLAEKQSDSPYNTYLYKGLPPTPICNPGLAAIKAAINPAETDCLFYLHDLSRQIHCSKTYQEHLENIKKYLD